MTAQSKIAGNGDVKSSNGYQRRRRETRRQLLEAGRALFVARAAEQVSIESITDRAGVAKGSFYNHFDSRDALFEEIIEDTLKGLLDKFAAFEPPIEDPLLLGLVRTRFTFYTLLSDPAACRLLLQGGQPSQGGPIDRVLRSTVGDRLAWGVSLGSLSHLEPELVYAAYFGVVTETIGYLLTREQGLDAAAAADELTQLSFAAMGLPHPPPPYEVPGEPA